MPEISGWTIKREWACSKAEPQTEQVVARTAASHCATQNLTLNHAFKIAHPMLQGLQFTLEAERLSFFFLAIHQNAAAAAN